MYSAIIALFAASSVIAAPVRRGNSDYAEGYLESYDTYHSRYLSIGCSGQQGTQFFSDCCKPLLASETVANNRPAYCAAGSDSTSSAVSASPSPSSTVEVSSAASQAASAPADAAVAAAKVSATSSAKASPSASPSPSKTASPSSASPSPAATSAASGGYQYTGGFATYFYQAGNAGACGTVHSDSDYGIAIDGNGFWQNYGVKSEHCGKYINIKNTNNGKTVKAQVWDVCPTCVNDNSLDLSVGAFNAIASPSDGMVPIEWSFA